MKRVKCLIIDLDDTLCNTFSDLVFLAHRDASKAMVEAGIGMSVDEVFEKRIKILEKTISKNFSKTFEEMLIEGFSCSQKIINAGFDAYYSRDIGKLTLFPLAQDFLNLCSFLKIALVTKGNKSTQLQKINKLNIKSYFDHVAIVEISNSKENEFRNIMKKWDLQPSEVFVIGDRPDADICIGNKLNMNTVRFKSEHYANMKPRNKLEISDYEVKNYKELIDLFNKNFI
tara:strand:- start:227 stop:913 length:687 start_codon:yes stop_codon:yes gene_type:complete